MEIFSLCGLDESIKPGHRSDGVMRFPHKFLKTASAGLGRACAHSQCSIRPANLNTMCFCKSSSPRPPPPSMSSPPALCILSSQQAAGLESKGELLTFARTTENCPGTATLCTDPVASPAPLVPPRHGEKLRLKEASRLLGVTQLLQDIIGPPSPTPSEGCISVLMKSLHSVWARTVSLISPRPEL